eukprot:1821684-Prymnesium_polylepis.1
MGVGGYGWFCPPFHSPPQVGIWLRALGDVSFKLHVAASLRVGREKFDHATAARGQGRNRGKWAASRCRRVCATLSRRR